jgi:hypothetical protein
MSKKSSPLTIDYRDIPQIEVALVGWFESQGLNIWDAAWVMTDLIGIIVGRHSDNEKHMQEGLEIFFREMTRSADEALKK